MNRSPARCRYRWAKGWFPTLLGCLLFHCQNGTGAEVRLPLAYHTLARDLLRELVEINTSAPHGTRRAAEAVATRLKAGGIATLSILGPTPENANVVARLPGAGRARPVLFIAHLDVVEAREEDWTFDPFRLTEDGGYLYGRGTIDVKNEVAGLVLSLLRLQAEGFKGDRDLIVALTADEEVGGHHGIQWLLREHRDLVDAEFCVNADAGAAEIRHGKHAVNPVQTAEKVYLSFRLEVTSAGGHSSEPTRDNAISHLAEGLVRLASFEFPIRVNETVRGYFARLAETQTGLVAEDMRTVGGDASSVAAAARLSAASPSYNALLRTTAVVTQISGGQAENALPQRATAIVNCRLLPEDSPEEVEATLVRVVGNEQIRISRLATPVLSPASPVNPAVFRMVEQITGDLWPGVPIMPVMSTFASDGLHVRSAGIPVYGVSGMFHETDDWARAHGQDERIAVHSYYDGIEFMYRLMKQLASAK